MYSPLASCPIGTGTRRPTGTTGGQTVTTASTTTTTTAIVIEGATGIRREK
jgi:hypothetical protein